MQELSLKVLVNLMEASDIRSSITDYEFCLLSAEYSQDLLQSLLSSNVSLDYSNSINGSHFLQINTDHSEQLRPVRVSTFLLLFSLIKPVCQDLRP